MGFIYFVYNRFEFIAKNRGILSDLYVKTKDERYMKDDDFSHKELLKMDGARIYINRVYEKEGKAILGHEIFDHIDIKFSRHKFISWDKKFVMVKDLTIKESRELIVKARDLVDHMLNPKETTDFGHVNRNGNRIDQCLEKRKTLIGRKDFLSMLFLENGVKSNKTIDGNWNSGCRMVLLNETNDDKKDHFVRIEICSNTSPKVFNNCDNAAILCNHLYGLTTTIMVKHAGCEYICRGEYLVDKILMPESKQFALFVFIMNNDTLSYWLKKGEGKVTEYFWPIYKTFMLTDLVEDVKTYIFKKMLGW